MSGVELHHDEKAKASLTLGDVIRQTAKNYSDPRFHPKIFEETPFYVHAGIDPSPYRIWPTADGIGTKPELAERWYTDISQNADVFEDLAFDTLAMIDGDEARFGKYMVGVAEIVDVNSAENQEVISALARGLKRACDEGHFALLTGETAELGYRTSGYGDTRLNWNAFGLSVINPDKLLLGKDLKPCQPIVAIKEKSIRSNGLTKARLILETAYLLAEGFGSKSEIIHHELRKEGVIFDGTTIDGILRGIFGHDAIEQVLIPWHYRYPATVKQLLMPSRLYGPLMYKAQGKIDEPRNVGMVAAAHVSGGGVPEKARRMVEMKGLGAVIDSVFPDPESVTSLLSIYETFPQGVKDKLGVTDRVACQQWNRGIGFMVVTENEEEAKKLVDIAAEENYEAKVAGEITDKREITFRGHTWTY